MLVRARWLPSTIDTAIPCLIGAGEATAALSLGDNTRWWDGISWSMLAGAVAFGHSAVCAALPAYAVALAVTSALAHLSPWLYVAAPWAVTAAAIVRVGQVRWGGVSAGDA